MTEGPGTQATVRRARISGVFRPVTAAFSGAATITDSLVVLPATLAEALLATDFDNPSLHKSTIVDERLAIVGTGADGQFAQVQRRWDRGGAHAAAAERCRADPGTDRRGGAAGRCGPAGKFGGRSQAVENRHQAAVSSQAEAPATNECCAVRSGHAGRQAGQAGERAPQGCNRLRRPQAPAHRRSRGHHPTCQAALHQAGPSHRVPQGLPVCNAAGSDRQALGRAAPPAARGQARARPHRRARA